jgi:hypothetical protein
MKPPTTLDAFITKGRRRATIIPAPPTPSPQEHLAALRVLRRLVDNCPFCGGKPQIGPAEPWEDGDAFGFVACDSRKCAARPKVEDGSNLADERGSAAYIALAIRRWNRRA